MGISADDIKKIAHLARLELTEKEIETFSAQIGDVLKYIDKLNSVNTDRIEPLNQVLEIETPLREDELRSANPYNAELMLSQAPEAVFDNFKVPQVIAGKGGEGA